MNRKNKNKEINKFKTALEIIKNIAPSTCQGIDDTCCIKCIAIQALSEEE